MIGFNPRVNISMELSACGKKCYECKSYSITCLGCYHTREIIVDKTEFNMCPIYKCAMEKTINRSCSRCNDLPCNLFELCVNPEMSKNEISYDIENRVKRLMNEE